MVCGAQYRHVTEADADFLGDATDALHQCGITLGSRRKHAAPRSFPVPQLRTAVGGAVGAR